MAAVAFKTGRLMGVVGPIGKPKRMFQTKTLIHARALGHQMIVNRGGFLQPPLRQRFIGEGHYEPAFIVFRRFHRAPIRRRPIAEARHIHGPDINGRLPINHPFRHGQPNAATLAKARHNPDRAPIVRHPRHGANHWISVRAKGEGAVDRLPNAHLSQNRNTLKGKLQTIGDLLQIWLQQLMAKVPRGAADFPRGSALLIGAQKQPVALLAKIDIGLIINSAGQTVWRIGNGLDLFRQQIVMLHRLHRNVKPLHMSHFTRPKPAAIDDMLGVDGPARRVHVPAAIRPLDGFCRWRMGEILCPMHLGRFGKGIGCPRGVQISILIIPQRGDVMFGINQRMAIGHFLGADELLTKAHVARLGPLAFEIIIPGFIRGQIKSTGHMQPDRMARKLFNLFI